MEDQDHCGNSTSLTQTVLIEVLLFPDHPNPERVPNGVLRVGLRTERTLRFPSLRSADLPSAPTFRRPKLPSSQGCLSGGRGEGQRSTPFLNGSTTLQTETGDWKLKTRPYP